MTIQTINVKPEAGAVYSGGKRQTELNYRSGHWWRSDAVSYDGSTTNTIFTLPPNSMIVRGFIAVETAFDASGDGAGPATATVTVTNDTGTQTIIDAATTGLQSTGWIPATAFCMISDTTTYPVALALMDPGTSTKGSFRVYLELVQMVDRL